MIRDWVSVCKDCRLAATRTKTVFERGNPSAPVMLVGEAPGENEDLEGTPFVGRAGQLLDKLLVEAGLDDVYIANAVKCRPPGNRKPEPDELRSCVGFLVDQIDAVRPRVIVALGATALRALTGSTMGITSERGKWKLYAGQMPVMPTFHPSYLFHNPGARKVVVEDLVAVATKLRETP